MKWLWSPHRYGFVAPLLALPLFGQNQPFTLRVNTRLVVPAVTVSDKDGKPIDGLGKDDFILTEDNVPQVIGVFDFERLDDTTLSRPGSTSPAPTAARGPAQPAASRTRIAAVPPGDSRYQDRRLLALYFDLPALSGNADRIRALEGALKFLGTQMTSAIESTW